MKEKTVDVTRTEVVNKLQIGGKRSQESHVV